MEMLSNTFLRCRESCCSPESGYINEATFRPQRRCLLPYPCVVGSMYNKRGSTLMRVCTLQSSHLIFPMSFNLSNLLFSKAFSRIDRYIIHHTLDGMPGRSKGINTGCHRPPVRHPNFHHPRQSFLVLCLLGNLSLMLREEEKGGWQCCQVTKYPRHVARSPRNYKTVTMSLPFFCLIVL
jgi:hypothetical protein